MHSRTGVLFGNLYVERSLQVMQRNQKNRVKVQKRLGVEVPILQITRKCFKGLLNRERWLDPHQHLLLT